MKQISAAEFESQVLGSPEPVLGDFYSLLQRSIDESIPD
jgi:hypothetical protein